MFSATESKELRFHFLHKRNGALSPIGYDKVDKATGESVPDDEIVRGFEFEKGNYAERTKNQRREARGALKLPE